MFSATTMLTDEQERAVALVDAFLADSRCRVFNLHGLAGTGKTTVLRHVAAQYKHAVLCSLTGTAASVLRRRIGLQACTLHSFFYRLIEAIVLPDDTEATTSFDFGYAMTGHKAQGSEWDSIVLVDEYRRPEQRQAWLYTGITRAAVRILVVR